MNSSSYGFAETYINDNNKVSNKYLEWEGNYDGKHAFINLNMNDNGHAKSVSMELDNKDLLKMIGIPTVQMALDKRLIKDFSKSKRHNKHKRKTKKRK